MFFFLFLNREWGQTVPRQVQNPVLYTLIQAKILIHGYGKKPVHAKSDSRVTIIIDWFLFTLKMQTLKTCINSHRSKKKKETNE